MRIDLSNAGFFTDGEIILDKPINFIFGKNGTGKSTISKFIKEQNANFDVRIFQGFDGVVDEDNRLNAVVLGEENIKINDTIKLKTKKIEELQKEINRIESLITEPENGKENLWTKRFKARNDFEDKDKEISKFYTKAASIIKYNNEPQIADPNYNTNTFQKEIKNAKLLQDIDILKLKNILKSEVKLAKAIEFPDLLLEKQLDIVNEILNSKVEEKTKIFRIDNDNKKRMFAKTGLEIHNRGEVCAFCGNKIEEETLIQLENYFSADEVKLIQEKIKINIDKFEIFISKIKDISVNQEDFYSEYIEEMKNINFEIEKTKEEYIKFFESLIIALNDKLSNIFNKSESLILKIPNDFKEIKIVYEELLANNNQNKLEERKREARDNLRYHEIKILLDEYKYETEIINCSNLKKIKVNSELDLSNEKNKIEGKGLLNEQILEINKEIRDLQSQTRNEKKLAENINSKLKNFVSFKLVHCNDYNNKGFYQVKCNRTGDLRDITKLSTGEKNVIAFLYFIEKINEIDELEKKQKVIIFDDPMNSNDDTMQYLIIEELQKLIKKTKEPNKMIILTHNNHFYLNVKYERKYDNDKFIRLISNGKKVKLKYIVKKEEDFKTNYEALWNDLRFLYYNEDASPEILLNPIRRIIETYAKFNSITLNEFYQNTSGARKFFNVNSHSIDDLETDLNGQTKLSIIKIMKDCFEKNNAIKHFECFCNIEIY